MKTMLIAFFNIKGNFRFEFIHQGQTVNQAYSMETMKRLSEAVRRKGLNFGPAIGFPTTTILQVTKRSLPSSLWPKNRLLN
jgi:hypothetical protein